MFQVPPARYILPNLFTLASAFCGFAAIWMAATADEARDFYLAASLIPIACILDGFDGRVARLVQGQSKFGVQYDSLADFLAFGVAPGVLVYFWGLQSLGAVGLAISFLIAAAAMTRLARLNVTAEEETGVSKFFQGLPAPFGGLAIAGLVAFGASPKVRNFDQAPDAVIPGIALVVLVISLLMVSTVPFRTYKDLRMTPRNRLIVATMLALVVVVSVRFDIMFALSLMLLAYIVLGLTSNVIHRRRARRDARFAPPGLARTSEDSLEDDLDDELEDDGLDEADDVPARVQTGRFFQQNDDEK